MNDTVILYKFLFKKNAIDLCNTTGATSGARSTYTSGTIVFTPRFSEVVLLSI